MNEKPPKKNYLKITLSKDIFNNFENTKWLCKTLSSFCIFWAPQLPHSSVHEILFSLKVYELKHRGAAVLGASISGAGHAIICAGRALWLSCVLMLWKAEQKPSHLLPTFSVPCCSQPHTSARLPSVVDTDYWRCWRGDSAVGKIPPFLTTQAILPSVDRSHGAW